MKPSEWLLVMTADALFRTKDWKTFPAKTCSLTDITGLSISGKKDSIVVVHTDVEDRLYNLLDSTGVNHVAEFATRLVRACKLKGKTIDLSITGQEINTVSFEPVKGPKSKGPIQIKLMEDPSEVAGCHYNPKTKAFVYF